MDNCIFYFRPHFLSTDCRKSRNKSFSIFKHLFSYLYSASVFAGFLPRFFGMAGILGSFNQLWIAYLLIPYSLLSARWVSPSCSRATTASRISLEYLFIPFFPDITIPPFVVISSYLRGLLSIVRFFWCGSLRAALMLWFCISLPACYSQQTQSVRTGLRTFPPCRCCR